MSTRARSQILMPLLLTLLLTLPVGVRGEIFAGAGDSVIVSTTKLLGVGPGWTLQGGGGKLVYERKRPVWVLPENRINAPASRKSAAALAARIKKHGRRIKPRIIFKMEPRWSAARVARARRDNATLGAKIAALGKKHRVEHLLAPARRRKNNALGASAAQRARLAAYQAGRRRLEARRIRLPDYHTAEWSLTFLRHVGFSDAYHRVHPPAAAEECYRLDRQIRARLLPVEGARAVVGALRSSKRSIPGAMIPGAMIAGTMIPDTKGNREVVKVIEAYRQALIRRDAAALAKLVHPAYHDDAGTPDTHDDVDRKRLLRSLRTLLRSVRAVTYTIQFRKVSWISPRRADAEASISATYELKLPGGGTKRQQLVDLNRFRLQRHRGRWLLISGM